MAAGPGAREARKLEKRAERQAEEGGGRREDGFGSCGAGRSFADAMYRLRDGVTASSRGGLQGTRGHGGARAPPFSKVDAAPGPGPVAVAGRLGALGPADLARLRVDLRGRAGRDEAREKESEERAGERKAGGGGGRGRRGEVGASRTGRGARDGGERDGRGGKVRPGRAGRWGLGVGRNAGRVGRQFAAPKVNSRPPLASPLPPARAPWVRRLPPRRPRPRRRLRIRRARAQAAPPRCAFAAFP